VVSHIPVAWAHDVETDGRLRSDAALLSVNVPPTYGVTNKESRRDVSSGEYRPFLTSGRH
jgi:hypothetical protein